MLTKMKNEFTKKIRKISQITKLGMSEKDVIDDLVQVTLNVLCDARFMNSTILKAVYPNAVLVTEKGFLEPLNKYKNDLPAWELLQELSEQYFELVKVCDPYTDIFDLDYGSKQLNKMLGQFLTPNCISTALPGFINPMLEDGKHTRVADVCCGGGALMLGAVSELYHKQSDLLKYVHTWGVDLDYRMCRMTALQLLAPTMIHKTNLGTINIEHKNIITEYSKNNFVFVFSSDEKIIEDFLEKEKSLLTN